jgi:hypothetical protein
MEMMELSCRKVLFVLSPKYEENRDCATVLEFVQVNAMIRGTLNG